MRKGVVDLVDINDMPGIKNVSLTTNGVLLPRMAEDLAPGRSLPREHLA